MCAKFQLSPLKNSQFRLATDTLYDFPRNGRVNRHNSIYWAVQNPREMLEREISSPGIMGWLGISSSGIIAPFFCEESVIGDSYQQLLENTAWPEIADWPEHRRTDFSTGWGASALFSTGQGLAGQFVP